MKENVANTKVGLELPDVATPYGWLCINSGNIDPDSATKDQNL